MALSPRPITRWFCVDATRTQRHVSLRSIYCVARLESRCIRLFAALIAILVSLFVFVTPLYAGSITIEPGNANGPNVYGDDYINGELVGAPVTLDTALEPGGGPNEIYIIPGVEIAWTTGNTLTLIADASIVVSGTIQHDGPTDGSGGVVLLANNDDTDGGDVRLGLGTQPNAIAVGSRFGLTRVDGENVQLQAGDNSAENRFVLLGFRAVDQGVTYTVTGPISITASLSVTALAGGLHFNFVQIGHGGADPSGNETVDGNFAGDVTIVADEIRFDGGSSNFTYAQVGNGGFAAVGSHSGSHTLTAKTGAITFSAGGNILAYAQVGNGGFSAVGSHSGDHTLEAGNHIAFTGGDGESAYAQVGNGGIFAVGSHSGNHTLEAGNHIAFTGGGGNTAHAQAGNGGLFANGNHSGNHTLTAQGNITFTGGGSNAYAQAGNGGLFALGNMTGSHTISAIQTISFSAGSGVDAYAQAGNGGGMGETANTNSHGGNHLLQAGNNIVFTGGVDFNSFAQAGNGGTNSGGNMTGSHTLTAQGSIVFAGGDGEATYAQAGNGGYLANGNHSGDHSLDAGSDITFSGGSGDHAYALMGNGGYFAAGNHSGSHSLQAGGNITFGAGSGVAAFVQVGNGGSGTAGDHSGNHSLVADGNISLIAASAGGVNFGYAQVGNGAAALLESGARSGDITLVSGEHLILQGARIGHATNSGSAAISSGNTFIAVGQNDPLPTGGGSILVGHALFTATFNSAPLANDGELRFYVPRESNVLIAANTLMNSELFPGNVPPERMAGFFPFAEGPYIPDYSFYFGPSSDLAVAKVVEPSSTLLPGQPLTYTLAFSNSGLYTASNVILTDTLPLPTITNISIDSALGPGVTITQTGNAPNLVWQVSDLAAGAGGVITVNTHVTTALSAPISITNSADITGTLDFTPTNNSASVNSAVNVPSVGFDPTTYAELEGTGSVTLTVRLDFANPYTDTVVTYVTSDGTATVGSDYATPSGNLTIPAGEEGALLSIILNDDALVEANELFTVTLTAAAGANPVLNSQATVTILDDDSDVSIGALDADKAEGNSGPTAFTFTASRTGYLTGVVTVDYAVSGAVDGADFVGGTLPAGSVTLNSGESSKLITVTVQGDLVVEADKPFAVTLSNPSTNATIVTAAAAGVIRNDDSPPALTVSKVANVMLARVGETITYTYRITNSGGLTFTALVATDEPLGPVTLDKSSLAVGEVATGQLTYIVVEDDVPGPLLNIVTVTATPVVGDDVVVSTTASVNLVSASFNFSKTVGIQGIEPQCTTQNSMQVPISTTVVYCFTITNTGTEVLTRHTLEDSQLGTVLAEVAFNLAPGASYSTTVTRTLYASVTNTAIWTAGYAGSEAQAEIVSIAALPAQSSAEATVTISDDAADQDNDGIPDNIEQAADVDGDNQPNFLDDDSDGDGRPDRDECPSLPCRDSNNDGTPDFLDPNDATSLDPEEQPRDHQRLFMPVIEQE